MVTGRDEKGRKQYIYHPNYIEKQKSLKYDRIIHFAEQLETMRRVTGQHLRKKKLSREKVLATMVRLLEHAYFRPGSKKYTDENDTYGLTTMRSRHLDVQGNEITFSYVGKSGQEQEKHIIDKKLAKVVQELDEIPGYRIFKYYDEEGEKQFVDNQELNEYIQEVMGEEFSAKDFRTWAGTMIAAMALDECGAVNPKDQKELDKNIREAVNKVSEMLGNTPAVARSSYIDPRVIEEYIDGKTLRYFSKQIKKMISESENLSEDELSVLYMLRTKMKS